MLNLISTIRKTKISIENLCENFATLENQNPPSLFENYKEFDLIDQNSSITSSRWVEESNISSSFVYSTSAFEDINEFDQNDYKEEKETRWEYPADDSDVYDLQFKYDSDHEKELLGSFIPKLRRDRYGNTATVLKPQESIFEPTISKFCPKIQGYSSKKCFTHHQFPIAVSNFNETGFSPHQEMEYNLLRESLSLSDDFDEND